MKFPLFSFFFALILLLGCYYSNAQHVDSTKAKMKADSCLYNCLWQGQAQTIVLPVFIPVEELQNQLYKTLFEPNKGRFYPCPGKDCDELYRDVYCEYPKVTIDSNIISIQLHLAGNTKVLFLHPGISEYITLTTTPEVKNDTIFFRNITMEQTSGDILLGLTSALYKDQIEQTLQQKAWYPLHPALDSLVKSPLKWNSIALLLNLKKLYLNKISAMSSPKEGILIDISADVEVDNTLLNR